MQFTPTQANRLTYGLAAPRGDRIKYRPDPTGELVALPLDLVDELGYVPLSKTGAELLFEIFSQRYEQASTKLRENSPTTDTTASSSPTTGREQTFSRITKMAAVR